MEEFSEFGLAHAFKFVAIQFRSLDSPSVRPPVWIFFELSIFLLKIVDF